jgi:hypothetical protein
VRAIAIDGCPAFFPLRMLDVEGWGESDGVFDGATVAVQVVRGGDVGRSGPGEFAGWGCHCRGLLNVIEVE